MTDHRAVPVFQEWAEEEGAAQGTEKIQPEMWAEYHDCCSVGEVYFQRPNCHLNQMNCKDSGGVFSVRNGKAKSVLGTLASDES